MRAFIRYVSCSRVSVRAWRVRCWKHKIMHGCAYYACMPLAWVLSVHEYELQKPVGTMRLLSLTSIYYVKHYVLWWFNVCWLFVLKYALIIVLIILHNKAEGGEGGFVQTSAPGSFAIPGGGAVAQEKSQYTQLIQGMLCVLIFYRFNNQQKGNVGGFFLIRDTKGVSCCNLLSGVYSVFEWNHF